MPEIDERQRLMQGRMSEACHAPSHGEASPDWKMTARTQVPLGSP